MNKLYTRPQLGKMSISDMNSIVAWCHSYEGEDDEMKESLDRVAELMDAEISYRLLESAVDTVQESTGLSRVQCRQGLIEKMRKNDPTLEVLND